MNIIGIKLKFSSAHRLVDYPGDCSNLHGHTWKVDVEFEYDPSKCNITGMAVDFKIVKKKIEKILPDHCYLNQWMTFNPTAENIIEELWIKIAKIKFISGAIIRLKKIRLYESEDAYVEKTI